MKTFENAFDKFKQNVKSVNLGMIPVVICFDKTTSKFYRVTEFSMGTPARGNEMPADTVCQLAKQGVPICLAFGSGVSVELMSPTLVSITSMASILVFYNTYVDTSSTGNNLINHFVRFSISKTTNTVTFTEKKDTYDLTSLKK